MINNGDQHYEHDKDGSNELAGCEAEIRSKIYQTLFAVRYQNNTLTVCINNKKSLLNQNLKIFLYLVIT